MTENGEESSLHLSLIQQYTVTAQTAIVGSHLAKKTLTRLGVDKVKPKGWFKYF